MTGKGSSEGRVAMRLLRRAQSDLHGKDATELNASSGDGVAPVEYVAATTATASVAITTTTASTTALTTASTTALTTASTTTLHGEDDHLPPAGPASEEEEYLALFPKEPETSRAATTFEVFSDLDRFEPEAINETTHFLAKRLAGALWLDADADGRRGSATDPRLNAIEYDVGIGGVKVQLVNCTNDEPVFLKTSLPNAGFSEGSSMKRTDVPEAGLYDFPLETVQPGRYYVMYQAPRNYRVNGNVLPLEREVTDDEAYFECIPRGGEGSAYLEEVMGKGDLDWGGYCARSIGCLEVDKKSRLSSKFSNLEDPDGGGEEEEGNAKTLVALPSPNTLNVGLAEEEWELSTFQFADTEITLSFPSSVAEGELGQAVPPDFARSEVRRELETTLKKFYSGGSAAFRIQGVELHEGEIIVADSENALPEEDLAARRGLRGFLEQTSRVPSLPQDGDAADGAADGASGDAAAVDSQAIQVRYTLTTRGAYNPPPQEQLGTILQDSVNRDPERLVRSLKERQEELPPVFEQLGGATARHLTTQVTNNKLGGRQGALNLEEKTADGGGRGVMADWAKIPTILLALVISMLIGTLVFRRVFVRRKRAGKRYRFTAAVSEDFLHKESFLDQEPAAEEDLHPLAPIEEGGEGGAESEGTESSDDEDEETTSSSSEDTTSSSSEGRDSGGRFGEEGRSGSSGNRGDRRNRGGTGTARDFRHSEPHRSEPEPDTDYRRSWGGVDRQDRRDEEEADRQRDRRKRRERRERRAAREAGGSGPLAGLEVSFPGHGSGGRSEGSGGGSRGSSHRSGGHCRGSSRSSGGGRSTGGSRRGSGHSSGVSRHGPGQSARGGGGRRGGMGSRPRSMSPEAQQRSLQRMRSRSLE